MSDKSMKVLDEIFSDEKNVERFKQFIGKLDNLNYMLDRLELFLGSGMVDELLGMIFSLMALERAFMKEEMTEELSELAARFTFFVSPKCMSELRKALDSRESLGILGLLKKLRDPDVQRGLAIVMDILKIIGKCNKECQMRRQ
ncbi:MAG: DUF1641 domain-containing protein [Candidatus Methanodesulfokora washburnensis]|jgi:uncharacterized protein YjgD (DUF1641 family)